MTIRHQKIFQLINERGFKVHTKGFIIIGASCMELLPMMQVRYQQIYKENICYIGIKATAKSFKLAVTRNKIRRQIRDIVYSFLKLKRENHNQNEKQGFFFIIIPKSINSIKKFKDIKSDLCYGLQKLLNLQVKNADVL